MDILEYTDLTYDELGALDRDTTVFLSSISPLETHGPHLPLGTDVFLAEHLRDRIIGKLEDSRPELTVVKMPTLAIGSDAIPVSGSIRVRFRAILFSLLDTGKALSGLGFKYWVLTDNHGGPHHQIAIEIASRALRRQRFILIAPFHETFRRMVGKDPDLLDKTGLPEHRVGGPDDAHGGTNETSLMLAAFPEKVREAWQALGPGKKSPMKPGPRFLEAAGKLLGAAGARDAATDFHFLAHGLAWVSDPDMDPYQGTPSEADPGSGEAMLEYRADLAVELLEEALAGKARRLKPVGWSIRALRDIL